MSEEAILDAALELPPEERGAFLDQACGGDASLRALVAGRLRAHRRIGTSPQAPAIQKTIALSFPPGEEFGDRIGRYKLLQKIGDGGCGVVYMAEQEY